MAPQPWADDEQMEFLQSYFDEYYELQNTGKYTDFWATVHEAWFTRWPALAVQCPGKQASELTDTEREALKSFIKLTKNRIKTWFRWQVNPKAKVGRRGRWSIDAEDIFDLGGSGTRRLKEHEMFSRMYYKEKVKPVVQDELQRLEASGNGVKKVELINYVKRRTKEIYDAQLDDVKAEVREAIKELARSLESPDDDDSEPTPEQYQAAIDACPDILIRTLKALRKKTGWAFSVLLGGPDPRGNGQISSASMHVGETANDANFSHVHPEFKSAVLQPYTEFLKTLYPESVRLSRSLNNESSDGEKNAPKEDLDHDAEGESDPDTLPSPVVPPVISKKDNGSRKITKSPKAKSVMEVPSASPKNVPILTAGLALSPTSTSMPPECEPPAPTKLVPSGPASDADQPAPAGLGPTAAATYATEEKNPEVGPSAAVALQAAEVALVSPASAQEPHLLNHAPQVGNFNNSFNPLGMNTVNWDEFDQQIETYLGFGYDVPLLQHHNVLPSIDPSATSMWEFDAPGSKNEPSHHLAPFESVALLSIPTIPFTGADGDAQPVTFSHIPTTHAQIPASFIVSGSSALLSLPARPYSINDNAQHTTSSHVTPTHAQTPFIATSPASMLPCTPDLATPDLAPSVSASVAGAAPTSNTLTAPQVSEVPTPALTSASQPLNQSATENRRSGRPLVPSKRLDQMNMIGSKETSLIPSAGKSENIPPGQRPEWVDVAQKHLLEGNLGQEWTSCVEGWLILEEQLGFGTVSGCKGSLPVSRRPAEWSRWVTKAKNGLRAYDSIPDLMDPAEFGIAVQKWWCDIQPSFRKGDSLIPAGDSSIPAGDSFIPAAILVNPIPCGDNNDWKDLRKGGQNGLVSLLIMLLWWGRGLAKRTQWQDDSSPQWKATVVDVSQCLGIIGASSLGHNGKKRKVESRKGATKRARLG